MKRIMSLIIASVLIISLFALSASAIYELQDEYDYCAYSWFKNGECIGNFYVSYGIGTSWWYADDAEVNTMLEIPYDVATSDVVGYSYAEIRNDWVDHVDSEYVDTVNSVTRIYASYASIDDVYATYTHHNNAYEYKGVTQAKCPVTYGER